MEMYPGTSGSTHGERKEINPAPKAPSKETSVETGVINPLILFSSGFLSILAQKRSSTAGRNSPTIKIVSRRSKLQAARALIRRASLD
jgi:hypothetical protein